MSKEWHNRPPYSGLEDYVGKRFFMELHEVDIVCLLGGESGPPFFLCKTKYFDHVFCRTPMEVLPYFDDLKRPIIDERWNIDEEE